MDIVVHINQLRRLKIKQRLLVFLMEPLLDDNSKKGLYVCSDLGYLICFRHLFRSRAEKI